MLVHRFGRGADNYVAFLGAFLVGFVREHQKISSSERGLVLHDAILRNSNAEDARSDRALE